MSNIEKFIFDTDKVFEGFFGFDPNTEKKEEPKEQKAPAFTKEDVDNMLKDGERVFNELFAGLL